MCEPLALFRGSETFIAAMVGFTEPPPIGGPLDAAQFEFVKNSLQGDEASAVMEEPGRLS
jgi:hypothetical protein